MKCDFCNMPLPPECDNKVVGFVVVGNILAADALGTAGGIIGDNLTKADANGMINVSDIRQNVFCRACLLKIITGNDEISSVD